MVALSEQRDEILGRKKATEQKSEPAASKSTQRIVEKEKEKEVVNDYLWAQELRRRMRLYKKNLSVEQVEGALRDLELERRSKKEELATTSAKKVEQARTLDQFTVMAGALERAEHRREKRKEDQSILQKRLVQDRERANKLAEGQSRLPPRPERSNATLAIGRERSTTRENRLNLIEDLLDE
uniref:Uncharacterized protein n=1 Tax=Palpitomonas bilix TaxID=652834 RepID=A0A7S3CY52_9EUKA